MLHNFISLEDQGTILLHLEENLSFGTLWMLVGLCLVEKQPRGFTYPGDAFLWQQCPPKPQKLEEKQACGPKKGFFHLEFLAGKGGLAACMPPH